MIYFLKKSKNSANLKVKKLHKVLLIRCTTAKTTLGHLKLDCCMIHSYVRMLMSLTTLCQFSDGHTTTTDMAKSKG